MTSSAFSDDEHAGATKKLIRSVETCAMDAWEGFVAVNTGVRFVGERKNLVREDYASLRGKVAVVAGCGSGHEPYAAGYIGKGMLAGAVQGKVFASPPSSQSLPLLNLLHNAGCSGILLFVINYTGSRLNFALAVEKMKRRGVTVDYFVCADDSADTHSASGGRRGIAGAVPLLKIAGALAEEGVPLPEIMTELQAAVQGLGTIGVCLYPCSLPGQGLTYELGGEDIDLGVGIHGEPGMVRMPMQPVPGIIVNMITHITNAGNTNGLDLNPGDDLVLVVNNLGGISYMEELIVCKEAIKHLEGDGCRVVRAYHGRLMTALELAGVQLTILRLDTGRRKRLLKCLDAPTDAPAWPRVLRASKPENRETPARIPAPTASVSLVNGDPTEMRDGRLVMDGSLVTHLFTLNDSGVHLFREVLKAVETAVRGEETLLNDLDASAGDGDTGTTLLQGIKEIRAKVNQPGSVLLKYPRLALGAMSEVCENHMHGTSGALYSLMLAGAAHAVRRAEQRKTMALNLSGVEVGSWEDDRLRDPVRVWIDAFCAAVENVRKYGMAEAGDRTMLDALLPAMDVVRKYEHGKARLPAMARNASKAALSGANRTIGMQARVGRASYVSPQLLKYPDAGATAVAIWMHAVSDTVWAGAGAGAGNNNKAGVGPSAGGFGA